MSVNMIVGIISRLFTSTTFASGASIFLLKTRNKEARVPTDTGKPGKMRQLFPVREKSGNFEKMSKGQGILREGKLIHRLKFNQLRIKILLNFSH